jgi:hypothetical protein
MLHADKLKDCFAHNAQVLQFLTAERPSAVIIAAQWGAYAGGKHAVNEALYRNRIFEAGILKLRALGIRVYVVQDVPSATLAEPRALAKAHLTGATVTLEPGRAAYLRRDVAFRTMSSDLQRRDLIEIIDPALRLCDAQSCRVTQGGYPLYYDSNHLSARGALFVAPVFAPMMRSLAAPPAKETGGAPNAATARIGARALMRFGTTPTGPSGQNVER